MIDTLNARPVNSGVRLYLFETSKGVWACLALTDLERRKSVYLKRTSRLLILILTVALPIVAQEPGIEYGHPDELRGVTKVFVDTGVDTRQREQIAKEIQKRLPILEVVSRPEESDIHLRFSLRETRDGRTEGVGTVVKLVGSNRVRMLLSFKDYLLPLFERESIVNFGVEYAKPRIFAQEFVKAYRRANGESKA
jgi:hypothetical protein